MSDPFIVWDTARRSGGLKYHPKTEENMGMKAPTGPGFFSRVFSKSWGWLKDHGFGLLVLVLGIVAATYVIKMFKKPTTYREPTPILTEAEQSPDFQGQVGKLIADGFQGMTIHLNTLSGNIEGLIAEIRAQKVANPDHGIAPEPVIVPVRVKERVEVKVPNPINKRLVRENERLRNELAGAQAKILSLEHSYKLKQKIIDDFYKIPIQPGYKRTLTHYGECPE